MKNTIIITGASKGLGNALALEYLKNGYSVYNLSRSKADNLNKATQIQCDLSNLEELESVFKPLLTDIKTSSPTSITLLNNAGSLGLINKLEKIYNQNIIDTININYTAPLLLNSMFIKLTEDFGVERKIRTTSSGAANSAIDGWSVYCSTKAAVDSMTKVIGVEQKNKANPVHTIAIYPGVVDTGMQAEIRNSSEEEFSNINKFKALKANNELASPESVAKLIVKIDLDTNIANGSIVDVRNY